MTNTIDAGPPDQQRRRAAGHRELAKLHGLLVRPDDGAGPGIATYNVYVSDDGGPFTLWQPATTPTSATFTGQPGHTYGFYSVATDNVGHVQPTPTAAQATTIDGSPAPGFAVPAGSDPREARRPEGETLIHEAVARIAEEVRTAVLDTDFIPDSR